MARVIGFIAIFAIGGIISLFTVSSDEAVKYNDRMIDLVEQGNASFTAVSGMSNQWYDGKEIDVQAFSAAIEQLQQSADGCVTTVKSIVPPDSSECQAFHQAVSNYLVLNVEWGEKYQEIATYAESANPATEKDQLYYDQLMADLIKRDEAAFNQISETQKRLARAHNITLQ